MPAHDDVGLCHSLTDAPLPSLSLLIAPDTPLPPLLHLPCELSSAVFVELEAHALAKVVPHALALALVADRVQCFHLPLTRLVLLVIVQIHSAGDRLRAEETPRVDRKRLSEHFELVQARPVVHGEVGRVERLG